MDDGDPVQESPPEPHRRTRPGPGPGTPPARALDSAGSRHILSVIRWPLGGIRTYLLYTSPALVAAGWRVTFLGPAGEYMDRFGTEVATWPGVDCVTAPSGRGAMPLKPVVRDLLRERPYALVTSQGLGAAAQVELARRKAGASGRAVPHVVISHDVFPPGHHTGLRGWVRRRVLERLLRGAQMIVSVTEDAQANLLENLPALARQGPRLVTVPHGIRRPDTGSARDVPPAPRLREQLGLAPGTPLLGFFGRFMEQKGFLPLLDALQRLQSRAPPAPLHLVAVGSGDYEREYQADAQARGLAACVSFLPAVPSVLPYLPQIDLVVMPSLWEAAGLLAMEALIAGVPLLASDCLGLREVVRDTPARTAPAGDAQAWADALASLLGALPKDAARAFAPQAARRFDAQRTGERMRALFDEVVAATGRPA